MNYFEYINNLEPDKSLKKRTKAKVMSEISKQNIKKSNTKKACISIAACFIVLFISISTLRVTIKNSDDPAKTEQYATQNISSDTIWVNTVGDGLAAGPEAVLFEDMLYLQYSRDDIIEKEGSNKGKIEINKSDIGEFVYTINENNLVDGINFKFLKHMDTEAARQNKFYNAKVYRLKNCKNNTVLLVQRDAEEEEYCFFFLKGINSKNTPAEILDVFTAQGNNPIQYINVLQQDENSKNTELYIKRTTIKDNEAINSVVDILESCTTDCDTDGIVKNGFVKNELTGDEYLLEIVFEDNTKLNVYLHKEYFSFFITQEDEYDYYLFNNEEYDSLLEIFNN